MDVAKEAADIGLLEKDLGVLVQGVREGRTTFANTLKYVFMATSANFGNMFSMAGVSLFLRLKPCSSSRKAQKCTSAPVKERPRINDNFLTVVALLSQMSTHASGTPGVLEVHRRKPPDDVFSSILLIHQVTSHGDSFRCRSLIDPALGAYRRRELWDGDRFRFS